MNIHYYLYSCLLIFTITYIHDYLYSDGLRNFGIPKNIWAAEKIHSNRRTKLDKTPTKSDKVGQSLNMIGRTDKAIY